MHEFKGAIFDMDGTLLDSMRVWNHLTQGFLAQFGVYITDADYAETEGMSQPQIIEYFLGQHPSLPFDAKGMQAEMDALISARYASYAKPKAGALSFLGMLRTRGVRMAVATLTARRHAEKALRDWGMLDYFDCLLTIEDVGVSKREPDIYLRAAERLALAPETCVVFEDAPYAAASAKRAGFRVCGMGDPAYAYGETELRAVSDYFVADSFDELTGKL